MRPQFDRCNPPFMLGEIPDPRRAEGKLYKLPYVVLFSARWLAGKIVGGHRGRRVHGL
jgi:hypothetical protein